jgi:hypothetical protein
LGAKRSVTVGVSSTRRVFSCLEQVEVGRSFRDELRPLKWAAIFSLGGSARSSCGLPGIERRTLSEEGIDSDSKCVADFIAA